MAIDRKAIEELNKHLKRKRMISIYYLIRKFLQEMGNENYKLIDCRISKQTIKNYEDWWRYHKNL